MPSISVGVLPCSFNAFVMAAADMPASTKTVVDSLSTRMLLPDEPENSGCIASFMAPSFFPKDILYHFFRKKQIKKEAAASPHLYSKIHASDLCP